MKPCRCVVLFAVFWEDGRLSIASVLPEERDAWSIPRGRDLWPAGRALGIRPVDSLELAVRPYREQNVPGRGEVRIEGARHEWQGPKTGGVFVRAVQRCEPLETASDRVPNRVTGLWSYVYDDHRLVLFSADDRAAAVAWASASPYGRNPPDSHVEAVDRIEVQLSPHRNGIAPTCYRVWIDHQKVGWPPVRRPPRGPWDRLPAELRLPIPSYQVTRAVSGQKH